MIIYVIVFFLLALYAWAYQNGQIKKVSILPFLVVLLVYALRDKSVGIDTQNYVDFFRYGRNTSLRDDAEIGFTYWLGFLNSISKSEGWFIFANSCLSMIPLLICIKKNSLNPYLSLLLFLIYDGGMGLYMNASRQAIAISFCISAIFIIDYKKIRSILIAVIMILFAATFHTSALSCLALLLVPIIPLTNKRIKILILLISVFVGLIIRLNFFNYLPDLFQIGLFADNASFYGQYIEGEIDLNFNGLITEILPVSILLYFIVKFSDDSPIERICFWSIILFNIFANTPFIPRLFAYGILPFIILLPNCYKRIPSIGKLVLTMVYLVMFVFFLLYSAHNNGIDVYKTFLSL